MSKKKKVKPKYEAPVLMPLGELARGQEQCRTGTGPSSGNCDTGVDGFSMCGSGSGAKSDCGIGSSPGSACTTGESPSNP